MTTEQCEICDQPGFEWFTTFYANDDPFEIWVCDTHSKELTAAAQASHPGVFRQMVRRAQQHKAQQAVERIRARNALSKDEPQP